MYLGVPDSLLQPCPIPGWGGGDFTNLGVLAEARKKALIDCNDDKAAARSYQEKAKGTVK